MGAGAARSRNYSRILPHRCALCAFPTSAARFTRHKTLYGGARDVRAGGEASQALEGSRTAYKDAAAGIGKSAESRSTESVLNTLILSSYDAQEGQLRKITRMAFDKAWELQLREGPAAGAWKWQVFHLAQWESSESQYQGAVFMALAVGWRLMVTQRWTL